jgi:hypothetical protein
MNFSRPFSLGHLRCLCVKWRDFIAALLLTSFSSFADEHVPVDARKLSDKDLIPSAQGTLLRSSRNACAPLERLICCNDRLILISSSVFTGFRCELFENFSSHRNSESLKSQPDHHAAPSSPLSPRAHLSHSRIPPTPLGPDIQIAHLQMVRAIQTSYDISSSARNRWSILAFSVNSETVTEYLWNFVGGV